MVISFYKGSASAALLDVFPNIGLNKSMLLARCMFLFVSFFFLLIFLTFYRRAESGVRSSKVLLFCTTGKRREGKGRVHEERERKRTCTYADMQDICFPRGQFSNTQ